MARDSTRHGTGTASALAYALACALVQVPVPARAGDASFSWRAPEGCPDHTEASERLRELSAHGATDAHVHIDRDPSGAFRARIRSEAGADVRELYGPECDSLSDAVLLVLALSTREEQARAPDVRVDAAPPARTPRPWSLGAGGFARLDGLVLPAATLGAGGTLAGSVGRVRGELDGSYFRGDDAQDGAARARFALATGTLRGCYAVLGAWHAPGPVAVGPCLAVELGVLRAEPRGLENARDQRALWGALWLGASAVLSTRTFLEPFASVELGSPLRAVSFDVEGHGTLFRTRPLLARGTLGVVAQFR